MQQGRNTGFFLMEFLPRLKAYLQKKDVLEHTWFHVSDEPGMKDLDSYRSAVQCMHSGLGDCRFLDALSDFEFYRLGLVEHPVVASDHLEPFLEAEIPLFVDILLLCPGSGCEQPLFCHAFREK